MADSTTEQTEQPKRASKLPWILLLVVLLGGGAVAAFMLLSKGSKAAHVERGPKVGPILALETMVVNLDEPGGTRYLKLALELELKVELSEEQKKLLPRLRDQIMVHLSSLTVAQVQKAEMKLALKKRIKKMTDLTFGKKITKAVYYKEIVMQ